MFNLLYTKITQNICQNVKNILKYWKYGKAIFLKILFQQREIEKYLIYGTLINTQNLSLIFSEIIDKSGFLLKNHHNFN